MRVLSFEEAPGYPWWHLLQVEGREGAFMVSHNWVSQNGMLHPGDEIEFELTSKPVYSDCQFRFVAALRRCSKEAKAVE